MAKHKKIIYTISIFLVILGAGFIISLSLDINNGFLPSFMLATGVAIWYYSKRK